jgi:oligoribonuclease NrnB/cAMP/cGMP phosphodiesterase (DHH superfamily)
MQNEIKLEKEYNIYFHDDFDGFASASVIYDFLKKSNSKVKSFNPVNYDLKNKWSEFKFKPNPIILDFYYHPKANF